MNKYRIKETGVYVEIRRGVDGYKYSTKCGLFYTEKDLEALGLTIEEIKPEPKKLYAYKYRREIFFSDEILEDSERVPELDITYPKKQQ